MFIKEINKNIKKKALNFAIEVHQAKFESEPDQPKVFSWCRETFRTICLFCGWGYFKAL